MKKIAIFMLLTLISTVVFSQEATLNVLNSWKKHSDVKNALYHYYLSQAIKLTDEREANVAKLATKADWEKRIKDVKEKLKYAIGNFPSKTPLNAKIVGISEKEDYTVEKIIFESRPDFYVTAALYIPKNLKGKAPAILHTIGHSLKAFKRHHYQRSAINFVKKGFVVLTFDPIGQDERVQYYSKELDKSEIGGTSVEHMYMGLQTLLVGKSLSNYFVWDGIRAIDYLVSRKEVDTTRIGITGLSGGGTQAAFIAAADERVYATAPSCFITSMKRLFESIGPQDAEQNLYNGFANKIDFADLLEVRVPKPALVATTSRDFFSTQGATETEKEVQRVYNIFGAKDDFGRVEADSTHSMPSLNREARHRFFQKNLRLPGDPSDVEVKYLDKELQITETGQVSTSLGGETVFSLNKKEAEKLITKLEQSRKGLDKHLKAIKKTAKELSGYLKPNEVEDIVFTGRFQRSGYSVERYFIKGEGEYPIPFVLYLPNKITDAPILYLNEDGKSREDKVSNDITDEIREDIEELIKQGHPVVAADLIGFGEMKQKGTPWSRFGKEYGSIDYSNFFAAAQLNKSLVGIHAGDIERLAMFIKQDKRLKSKKIYAIAFGRLLTTSLLHASAFEKEFDKVVLVNPTLSYSAIVTNRYFYSNSLSFIVPGALTAYDLPDLMATITPNKLVLINVRNHVEDIVSDTILEKEIKVVKDAFAKSSFSDNLTILKQKNVQISKIFSQAD